MYEPATRSVARISGTDKKRHPPIYSPTDDRLLSTSTYDYGYAIKVDLIALPIIKVEHMCVDVLQTVQTLLSMRMERERIEKRDRMTIQITH
ncbi:hypothetical protein DBV15_08559 [Temnothorax longispinosus]|uniref:Uncharacterized protein n=1 Tax=Temnothorax longispinosus TaxID=300112 RepID=A0A4S2KYR0_9HYME|nr:hypothetical protein DBV15_08559 [Temnothorax longispinosus]